MAAAFNNRPGPGGVCLAAGKSNAHVRPRIPQHEGIDPVRFAIFVFHVRAR
jgi:hypothetical protein